MLQLNRFCALDASCCLLAFALSGCVSSAAQHLPNSDAVLQKRVSYAGLDLNSVTGARGTGLGRCRLVCVRRYPFKWISSKGPFGSAQGL